MTRCIGASTLIRGCPAASVSQIRTLITSGFGCPADHDGDDVLTTGCGVRSHEPATALHVLRTGRSFIVQCCHFDLAGFPQANERFVAEENLRHTTQILEDATRYMRLMNESGANTTPVEQFVMVIDYEGYERNDDDD